MFAEMTELANRVRRLVLAVAAVRMIFLSGRPYCK